jgi:hypothetical protein
MLSVLNKLYALFHNSPKRLAVLESIQQAIDGMPHKLSQTGSTTWLSYSGSIANRMHSSAKARALTGTASGTSGIKSFDFCAVKADMTDALQKLE